MRVWGDGSAKQVRWASEEGLATTQPWCANFVSADLKRHGVPLPPNPNYVPSYETEWSGGRNIGTDLAKAKPGDIVTYSGEHIGIYVGNGKVISGNYSNEVAESAASEGPAPISAILRPNYKGGKVRVAAGTKIPSYTGGTSIAQVAAGAEVSGSAPTSSSGTPRGKVVRQRAQLTPQQKVARAEHKLSALSSPKAKATESVTLKDLEKKYGRAAA